MSTPWMRMKPGSTGPEGSPVERAAERSMSQSEMQKVQTILRMSIPDEAEAYLTYNELRDLLRRAGLRRFADQVAGIARQEGNHQSILLDIQTRLARGER